MGPSSCADYKRALLQGLSSCCPASLPYVLHAEADSDAEISEIPKHLPSAPRKKCSEHFLLGTVLFLFHNFSLEICFTGFPHSPSSVRSLFPESFQSLSEPKKQGQRFPFLSILQVPRSSTLKQLCSESESSLLSL